MDDANPQTALGTGAQSGRDLSLLVSVLRASLLGEATGGTVCPIPWPAALREERCLRVIESCEGLHTLVSLRPTRVTSRPSGQAGAAASVLSARPTSPSCKNRCTHL